MSNIFFTADQHFGHANIIKFCGRPFVSVEEMDDLLIENHNKVVSQGDTVIHAGDFTLINNKERVWKRYAHKLNGKHIFLKGSHDYWLPLSTSKTRWEKSIGGIYIVVDHYPLRTWARSHYNSWQLHGHSHGKLGPQGKQLDVGVDNHNYFPVSFDQVAEIMETRPDNFNLVKDRTIF